MAVFVYQMAQAAAAAAGAAPTYTDLVSNIQEVFPQITDADELASIIKQACELFLYPPEVVVSGKRLSGYKWSFIAPAATLDTITEYSTGTVTVVDESTTIEIADGTWPSWVAAGHVIVITDAAGAEHTHSVASVSGTEIELTVAYDGTGAAGLSYVIHYHPVNYTLPASFGGMVDGAMHILDSSISAEPIKIVTIDEIWRLQHGDSSAGTPQFAAVIPVVFAAGTGQQHEIHFWPQPDAEYEITYRHWVNADSVATGEYVIGGAPHSFTMRALCRGVAEVIQSGGVEGSYWNRGLMSLGGSIGHDRRMKPRNRGYAGAGSEALLRDPMSGLVTSYGDRVIS